ncbi:MAG: hypothetical protein HS104_10235 [Polyangiaceae bacterium]|nr:hypothetical protein [Polyangiaceae bacterium]MCL4750919.1 hypothetical protein [Myxococcales bacterium]
MPPFRSTLPFALFVFCPLIAAAQPAGDVAPPPSSTPAPASVPSYPTPGAATNNWDVLVTADNRVLYVRVLRQEPGSFVTFQHPDKREETWSWAQVKVVALVPDRSALAGASAPSTTQIAPSGGARQETSRDCANQPGEICRENTATSVDGRGVSFGLQGQSVRRVVTPPSYDLGGALELSGLYGTSTGDLDLTLMGYSIQGGLRLMAGGQFPGPEGGGWSGVGVDLMGTFQGGFGKVSAAGTETEYEQATVSGSLTAGYQWLSFGAMDPSTLEQGGFGVFLGYRLGAAATFTTTKVGGTENEESTSGVAHGPAITLSFPKYNAGTAKLRRWTITAMAIYVSDFLIVTAGGGYTW